MKKSLAFGAGNVLLHIFLMRIYVKDLLLIQCFLFHLDGFFACYLHRFVKGVSRMVYRFLDLDSS
jgi:hypothetical protein